jgi:DNA-binding MarR family transcriptional regulator
MQTISTTDLAHRLRPVIARLARRMRQQAGGDLSPTQGAALNTIACHGPLTPSELAAREKIQRPTATRVLARLEEAGLIARAADPADRRSSLVAATEAGEALLATSRAQKDKYLAERLDRLSPEELAVLERAAGILERVLEEGAE